MMHVPKKHLAVALAVLTVLAVLATASSHAAELEKQPVPTLAAIPEGAELIVSSPIAGGKTPEGFPSNELYTADSKGGGFTRITHTNLLYNHFAVSPDRTKIAAIRYAGDTNRDKRINYLDRKTLWVLDLENKKEWALVPEYEAGWGGVDWTPDGEYICCSIRINEKLNLYRIHPDGTGFENLTENLQTLLGSDIPDKWVSDMSVSDDGEWLTFLYTVNRRNPNRIAVMRMDGSAAQIVTDGGGAESKHAGGEWGRGDFDPEFSPDGQYVCFQRATNAHIAFNVSSHDIYTCRIDGSELKRMSPEGNKGVHGIADWSDDNRIVFSEWNGPDNYVGPVLVNADGSGYHRIPGLEGAGWVRWIPRVEK